MDRNAILVIKPAGETRARGVTIGPEVSKRDWQSAIMSASFDPRQWVVQAVVPAAHTPILEEHENELHIENRYADYSVTAFWREAGVEFFPGFSSHSARLVSNILQGGKFVLPFLLRKK